MAGPAPRAAGAADCEHLHRVALGATPRRVLREIATALEVFTAARPLVLLLEDLHWSDHATLDVLSLLARRQGPARLLLLGTYRPEEVRERGHPVQALVQELQMHRHCEELPLPLLAEAAVATYLTARRQMIPPPERLTRFIHRWTDGNPLFMVTIVDYMLSHSHVGAAQEQEAWSARDEEAVRIPSSLQRMLTQQFEQLGPEEQQVLAAGSVVGQSFAAAAVAAGLQTDVEQVESWCARLTQRGRWLQSRGPCLWPDQTLSEGYAFSHTLYHEVVYNHLPITRRARLHRWVGERLETAYRGRVDEIAAELAVHFDRGRDYSRAVQYRQQAAENAMRRCAYHEAIHHLRRGLELLQMLPDSATRCAHELALCLGLGMSLSATKGYAHPDVEHLYARACELGRHMGEPARLIPALFGLWRSAMQRADYQAAHALGEQCLTLAQRAHDPVRLLKAHAVLGVTVFYLGDLVQARAHFAQGNALYDPQQHRVLRTFLHPAVACLAWEAFVLCMLGYLDRAVTRVHEARTLAQEFSHLYSLAHTLSMVAAVSQLRREVPATHAGVDASSALASEHEFAQIVAHVTILRGWTMVVQGQARTGIQHMCRGIEAWRATGAALSQPYWLVLLAEAYGKTGQTAKGLTSVGQARDMIARTGEQTYAAEVSRCQGELLLLHAGTHKWGEAETCFQQALRIAQRQRARLWELRAAMSLSRLWQQQGKPGEAAALLAPIYGWFTEGVDTADLREAKALLAELKA